MTNLSEHFTLEQLSYSATAIRKGIDNTPDELAIKSLANLCKYILEPLYDVHGERLKITSGYRSPDLNKLIGGSINSQHCKGEAADIHVSDLSVEELYQDIKKSDLAFDQLICEFPPDGWVHVSYSARMRKVCLLATRNELNQIVYKPDLA